MNRDKYKRIVSFLNKDIGPKKIDSRSMALFLNELSLLLNSGLSLDKSLRIILNQGTDKNLEKAIEIILKSLGEGESPVIAFNKAGGYFSPLILAFIRSGSETGNLGLILKDLSDFIFEESKNKSIVKQALTYPLLVLFVTILVVIAIVNFVMPSFIEIFAQADMDLPTMTKVLLKITDFFAKNKLIILLGIILLILIVILLRTDYRKRVRMDEFIFKFKPARRINRLRVEYQLTSLFYILRRADIEIIESFKILADSFKNTYIKEVLLGISGDLNKGDSLSLAFKKAETFSPLLLSMVDIGTETSSLDKSIKKSNEFFANEYIYRIKKIASLAEPVLVLLMGIIVAFVVFSVSIPMFDSINGINGG